MNPGGLETLDLSCETQSLSVTVEWMRALGESQLLEPHWHAHSGLEIHFARMGALRYRFETGVLEVRAGQALIIPSGTRHRLDEHPQFFRGVALNCTLKARTNDPETAYLIDTLSSGPARVFSFGERAGSLLALCIAEEETRASGFQTVIRAALPMLLMEAARSLSGYPSADYPVTENLDLEAARGREMLAFVERSCRISLSVGEIAAHMGLSERQTQRLCGARFGCTVKELVSACCLKRAKEMLRTPGVTLAELSGALGFVSEPSFCRFFRRLEGDTPGSYRKGVAPSLLPNR